MIQDSLNKNMAGQKGFRINSMTKQKFKHNNFINKIIPVLQLLYLPQ
jgi:hypothetical protein